MKRVTLKKAIASLALAVFALQGVQMPLFAQAIDASADLSLLTPKDIQLQQPAVNPYPVRLVKWFKQIVPREILPSSSAEYKITFSQLDGKTAIPTTRDSTGIWNAQGDVWSDVALHIMFDAGNNPKSAIGIWTQNPVHLIDGAGKPCPPGNEATCTEDPTDPLSGISARGGLVGNYVAGTTPDWTSDYRASVLPLFWKAVNFSDIQIAGLATAVGNPISGPAFMPTEIDDLNQRTCPTEGKTAGPQAVDLYNPKGPSTRNEIGFCDYSIHYVLDKFNLDPFKWYDRAANAAGQFRYASVVGAWGINISEQGLGGGGYGPDAYVLIGAKAKYALPTKYGTTLYVDKITR